jgi:hypothetical protein
VVLLLTAELISVLVTTTTNTNKGCVTQWPCH